MNDEERSARRVGTTVRDKWVLEQLIGTGGMASVYVARHKIGRREAIKILHPEVAASAQLRARFEQEARAVNALGHPGVVEVRDIDTTEDGAPFLVMELLEGESVAERSRREPPLEPREILRIASETLDVLAAAHERGIVHRDIKPDNLFLTREGKVKVLDFGVARVRASGEARRLSTKAGVTLGTMAYMPPEQARGLEIDGRADLYAVGATMFRLLARRPVHVGTDAELVMKVMSDPAPSLVSAVPGADAGLASIVDRALAYDRADRYPGAAEMRADVEAVLRGVAPPFASSAPPLPARPPPSSFGATPGPAPGAPGAEAARDGATFVPRAKRPLPDAPAAGAPPTEAETRAGLAPELLPTMLAGSSPVPSLARPSMPRHEPHTATNGGTAVSALPLANVAHTVRTPAGASAPGLATAPRAATLASARAAPVLTPFGELKAFIAEPRVKPQTTTLVLILAAAAVVFLGSAIALAIWIDSPGKKGAELPGLERQQPRAPAKAAPEPAAQPSPEPTTEPAAAPPAKAGRGRGRGRTK
jgi:eukaryotic-like serine/threonine-protein kinase